MNFFNPILQLIMSSIFLFACNSNSPGHGVKNQIDKQQKNQTHLTPYIDISSKPNSSKQYNNVLREIEAIRAAFLLNNHHYINFHAKKQESGKENMHFLILHNTIQAFNTDHSN